MKSLVSTLLTVSLFAPSATFALSIDDIIANAKAGGATVVESHSSASTGGQTVTSGQSVTTGASSASSHIETRINSGTEGGEVKVKVETTENGVTQTEEYTKPVASGEKVHIVTGAGTSSKAQGSVQAQAGATAPAPTSSTTASISNAPTSTQVTNTEAQKAPSSTRILFVETIPHLFKKVFAFLWWF